MFLAAEVGALLGGDAEGAPHAIGPGLVAAAGQRLFLDGEDDGGQRGAHPGIPRKEPGGHREAFLGEAVPARDRGLQIVGLKHHRPARRGGCQGGLDIAIQIPHPHQPTGQGGIGDAELTGNLFAGKS